MSDEWMRVHESRQKLSDVIREAYSSSGFRRVRLFWMLAVAFRVGALTSTIGAAKFFFVGCVLNKGVTFR